MLIPRTTQLHGWFKIEGLLDYIKRTPKQKKGSLAKFDIPVLFSASLVNELRFPSYHLYYVSAVLFVICVLVGASWLSLQANSNFSKMYFE